MVRLACLACALLVFGLAGCGTPQPEAGEVRAAVTRLDPVVPAGDAASQSAGDSTFAGRLLTVADSLGGGGNVVVSPFSISEALAMTLAGARGETARQISQALDFRLDGARLHAALDALDQELRAVHGLSVADTLFGQRAEAFRQAFLATLARYYGAGLHTVDFRHATDHARAAINRWVSAQTHGKIPQLLPSGVLDSWTDLVLVNAVYMKARWELPFSSNDTAPAPFYAPGGALTVPTMHETASLGYLRAAGYQVVELPYTGGRLAFDVLLPDPGRLPWLERRLAASGPLALLHGLATARMALALPRLKLRTQLRLKPALSALGMPLAFQPGEADLSGIAGQPGYLYLKDVVHEAYIRVDERGTEAAAATAAIAEITSAEALPPLTVKVDRPFVFTLRDIRTGAILFLGVVTRPLG